MFKFLAVMYVTNKDFVTVSVCQNTSNADLIKPPNKASQPGVLPLQYSKRVE